MTKIQSIFLIGTVSRQLEASVFKALCHLELTFQNFIVCNANDGEVSSRKLITGLNAVDQNVLVSMG